MQLQPTIQIDWVRFEAYLTLRRNFADVFNLVKQPIPMPKPEPRRRKDREFPKAA